jgi:hypothetical protein
MGFSGVQEPYINFSPRHYVCLRACERPLIDGRLDKLFWEKAPWSEEFVDIEGDIKPRPSKRTRFKILWDDEYLYFGAELEEDKIWATLTERDCVIFQDNDFEIFIDPDGDTHNYYEFEMNALNTIWDLFLTKPYRDNGRPVNSWDIRGIKTAVHINGELNNPSVENKSWSVEVAMPWSVLKECALEGRAPKLGEYWRVNFSRVQWRTEIKDGKHVKCINPDTGKPYPEDNWVWSPTGVINMHYPELWGYVLFAEEPTEFKMSPDEVIKWELRKLYYRQRNYYAQHGSYCKSFEELKGEDSFSITPSIETTSSLFQINAPSHDGNSIICIKEDGNTWRE